MADVSTHGLPGTFLTTFFFGLAGGFFSAALSLNDCFSWVSLPAVTADLRAVRSRCCLKATFGKAVSMYWGWADGTRV